MSAAMTQKHKNIPIFIPHLGCPHDCVFCNQKKISGHGKFDPNTVIPEIEAALSTMRTGEMPEIAFFGGSFTGIDRELMISLLDIAEGYVRGGRVSGIRMSTRPDYISEEILDVLSNYTVSAIELGLQSFDERVLALSERGHTPEQSVNACRAIVRRGIPLVGQMMIGLPGSDVYAERKTAEMIVSLGCVAARVYPTVVFRNTRLCAMAEDGEYLPITDEDAIVRTKEVLKILIPAGITLLRIGLCSNEDIRDPETVHSGAAHPAIGELCIGEYYYEIIRESLLRVTECRDVLSVFVPQSDVGKAVGQRRRNSSRLYNEFCREKKQFKKIRIIGDASLSDYRIRIETNT